MATDIHIVIGEKEPFGHPNTWVPQEMVITSFWGGKERGKMLQFTLGAEHIQLTTGQIIELMNVFEQWK